MTNLPRSFYLDLARYFGDMNRGQTPFTPAEGIVLQLHEKLTRILQTGTAAFIAHCSALASGFRHILKDLPVSLPSYPLSNALTPVLCPSAYEVFERLKDDYSIFVTPSGGSLRDRLLRVGHLGHVDFPDYERLAAALKEVLA